MKNQYSFRLTTTLLPTDTTAKTTDVINKVDANWDKFKPTFTEETVVITNDDRTIIETTRATCTNWVLSFTKRGLSDDNTETSIANRKLTWNPGSLCFVTAGAWDRIDPDDDIVWAGKQTYAWDMESRGKATYKGRLITEKGVEYPHFDTFADLEAYSSPFGGMFAVVDSSGELYRYNAVSEEWSVVTTATPVLPEQADDETIWSVRVATDAEFEAGTDTWSQWEYLMPTVSQVKSNTPSMSLNVTEVNQSSSSVTQSWATASVSYTVPHDWFLTVKWVEWLTASSITSHEDHVNYVSYSWTSNPLRVTRTEIYNVNPNYTWLQGTAFSHTELIAVKAWTFTATITLIDNMPSWYSADVKISDFFYFA